MPGMTKGGYKPPVGKESVPSGKNPERKPKKRKKANGALVLSLVILILCVAAAGGVIAMWKMTEPYQNAFLPGSYLSGCSLQGMTAAEGAELLKSLTADKAAGWQCELTWQGNSYILKAEDISLAVDGEATLSGLWSKGRNESMPVLFRSVLLGMAGHENVEPVITMNEAPVAELLQTVKQDIDREPEDASASFDPASSVPFTYTDEVMGYMLDTEPLKAKILAAARKLEPVSLELEPAEKEPKIYRAELENATVLRARVTAKLDSGEAGANERLALSALSGQVIGEGAVWSFNEAVGARTEDKGYVSAPEPAYGLTAEGIGGGVCRVSSMVYQAALLADLPVSERSQAVYPTDYADAGLEAAVSDQGLDLKFENNTDMPLWLNVRTWTDEGGDFAELQLIGVPLTEKIKLESVQTIGELPSDPVYVRDKDGKYAVYTDERVPVSEAKPAVTATVTRVALDKDGNELERKELTTDTYEAVPARIYVGASAR